MCVFEPFTVMDLFQELQGTEELNAHDAGSLEKVVHQRDSSSHPQVREQSPAIYWLSVALWALFQDVEAMQSKIQSLEAWVEAHPIPTHFYLGMCLVLPKD